MAQYIEWFGMKMVGGLLNYIFWWVVANTLRSLRSFLLNVLPPSVIKAEILEFLEDDSNVKVTMAADLNDPQKKSSDQQKEEDYAVEIVVHNDKFFKAIAQDDFLALGEAYMDGWFECDDLAALLGPIATGFKTAYPIVKLIMHAEDQLKIATNNQTVEKSVVVVEEHYNLGNDLYKVMLDPSMNYTCAYWKEDTRTLAEAQKNKMDLIARKLNLKPGMKILDIGSGFGSMAKYLAQNYNVSVTCYNISTEQVAYAKESCKGLDVTFIMEDYRNAAGQYDRIYSIGFFEAVGIHNFKEYFEVCHRCLKDDGLTLLHTITFNKAHPFPSRNPRWFDKYIFPGGELPYAEDYLTHSSDLFVLEDMQSLGKSYKKTLLEWHKNFDNAWDKHLKEKYEHQQGGKFYRMWVFYLLGVAGLFDSRTIQLDQVVFSKYGRQEEYKSAR